MNLSEAFRNQHPDWNGLRNSNAPIYSLPNALTSALTIRLKSRGSIIDKRQAQAEFEFSALCKDSRCVGFFNGAPITYPYLSDPIGAPSLDTAQQKGWNRKQCDAVVELLRRTKESYLRLKGYVGWLVADPQFNADRDRLTQLSVLLSPDDRPLWPLSTILIVPNGAPGRATSSQLIAFQSELSQFQLLLPSEPN